MSDSSFLGGTVYDTSRYNSTTFLEYETRIYENFILQVSVTEFSGAQTSDPSYIFASDDFIQIKLTSYLWGWNFRFFYQVTCLHQQTTKLAENWNNHVNSSFTEFPLNWFLRWSSCCTVADILRFWPEINTMIYFTIRLRSESTCPEYDRPVTTYFHIVSGHTFSVFF